MTPAASSKFDLLLMTAWYLTVVPIGRVRNPKQFSKTTLTQRRKGSLKWRCWRGNDRGRG